MNKDAKALVKGTLGKVIYWTQLPRLYFRDKYLITAFHRVNNATLGDGITCSPDAFRRVCRWLQRHFRVVSLHEQIRAVENEQRLAGTASITFDDGYRDNYEIAAPILRELGMPATFFVSTDYIGSTKATSWDARRGIQSEWMSWEQVAELARQGFDVESHTQSHLDLGRASTDEARRELAGSMQRLREAIGEPKAAFAYPFGGVTHITEEIRELIRLSGYRCCVSCYGGLNREGADVYRLRRMPVNEQYLHGPQFGLELLRTSV